MKVYQRHIGDFAAAFKKLSTSRPKQAFATPAQAIEERMKQGIQADISTRGAWYNASFSKVGGRILGTRGEFNPLIDYAKQATEAMRTEEFYLEGVLIDRKPASQVLTEIAEEDAGKPIHKRRVADFGQTETHIVPTDCFADDNIITFLAESGARANKYGLWLRDKAGIQESKVYMQNLVGKNKTRGFWLDRLGDGDWSVLVCSDRNLCDGDGSLFGVYESAKGTQKISGQK